MLALSDKARVALRQDLERVRATAESRLARL